MNVNSAKRERWADGFKRRTGVSYQTYRCRTNKRARQCSIVTTARSRAKRNGIEFEITVDELEWPHRCPILQTDLNYAADISARANSPSLDRVDNERGYVKGNVRVISHRANVLKSGFTDPAIFRRTADYIEGKI